MRKILLCLALLSVLSCAACTAKEESQPVETDNVQEKVSAFLRGENKALIEELRNGQE